MSPIQKWHSIPNQVVDKTGPLNYGVTDWMWPYAIAPTPASPLLTAMFDGGSAIDQYQCEQILGARLQRGNPVLPQLYALDDGQHLSILEGYVEA
jgi:uncharacterized protein